MVIASWAKMYLTSHGGWTTVTRQPLRLTPYQCRFLSYRTPSVITRRFGGQGAWRHIYVAGGAMADDGDGHRRFNK